MAHCPKCGGQMGLKEATCPLCGYDFPQPKDPDRTWQIVLIGAFVVVLSIWGSRDTPAVAILIGVIQVLFILGLVFKVWRFLRDS